MDRAIVAAIVESAELVAMSRAAITKVVADKLAFESDLAASKAIILAAQSLLRR